MNRIYITVFLLGLFFNFTSCKENRDQSKKLSLQEQEMGEKNVLEHLVRLPKITTNEPVPLLLLLHGLGSNEQDMNNLANSLDPRCMVLSVRAPYEVGVNSFSWYDLELNGGDFKYKYDELKQSRKRLVQLIEGTKEKFDIDKGKIMIGGFSQGAIMSLAVGLTHSDLIKGVIALSGDLLDEVQLEIEGKQIDEELDVYISHGRKDAVLPFAEAVKDVKYLNAKGIDVYEKYFDSSHTISQANFLSLSGWLTAKIDHQ